MANTTLDSTGLDPADYTTDTLNLVLTVLTSKEELFAILDADIKQYKKIVEDHMIILNKTKHTYENYSLTFRNNAPRHNMNWRLLQQKYAALYKKFRNEGMVTLTIPTKPQTLIFNKVAEVGQ